MIERKRETVERGIVRNGRIEIAPVARATLKLEWERWKKANRTERQTWKSIKEEGDRWGRPPFLPQSSSSLFSTFLSHPIPSHSNIGPKFLLCRRESSFDRWKRAVTEYVWNGSLSMPSSRTHRNDIFGIAMHFLFFAQVYVFCLVHNIVAFSFYIHSSYHKATHKTGGQ